MVLKTKKIYEMNAKYHVAKNGEWNFFILAHDLVLKLYVYILHCDLFHYFPKQSISLASAFFTMSITLNLCMKMFQEIF